MDIQTSRVKTLSFHIGKNELGDLLFVGNNSTEGWIMTGPDQRYEYIKICMQSTLAEMVNSFGNSTNQMQLPIEPPYDLFKRPSNVNWIVRNISISVIVLKQPSQRIWSITVNLQSDKVIGDEPYDQLVQAMLGLLDKTVKKEFLKIK